MAVKTYTFDKEFEELKGLEDRFGLVKEKVNNYFKRTMYSWSFKI